MKRLKELWPSVLCCVLIAVPIAGCKPKLDDGQAGFAYSENEEGELVVADGTRPNDSSKAPVKRLPKGSEQEWLSSFDLIERSGESVTSEQLKGQPYVASFFFTLCPSICVQQNEKVQLLQEKFSGQPIRFVSISCDPEVDRPEVLSDYADKFGADEDQWLFFTGELNYIRRVGSEMFTLPVMRRFHAEKFVLVDSTGEVYAYYTWTDSEQWQALQRDMAKMIEAGGKLDEPPEPAKNQNPSGDDSSNDDSSDDDSSDDDSSDDDSSDDDSSDDDSSDDDSSDDDSSDDEDDPTEKA